MYSKSEALKKYLHYFFHSAPRSGRGITDAMLLEFLQKVLNDRKNYPEYTNIERLRGQLLKDNTLLAIEDMGAGSRVDRHKKRSIKSIAHNALKSKKYAQLLFRIARYYKLQNILELGSSLGITTSYLATSAKDSHVSTFEGAHSVAEKAKENYQKLGLKNIELIEGNFDETLPPFLEKNISQQGKKIDFAFLDGNHREEPTIRYFRELLPYIHDTSIVVLDDIHWSEGMEAAWQYAQNAPETAMTVDLYFIGIVFFKHAKGGKKHYSIRF